MFRRAVEHQVDAGINLRVVHLGISGHATRARAGGASEIMTHAGQRLATLRLHLGAPSRPLDTQGRGRLGLLHHRLGRGEKQRIALGPC